MKKNESGRGGKSCDGSLRLYFFLFFAFFSHSRQGLFSIHLREHKLTPGVAYEWMKTGAWWGKLFSCKKTRGLLTINPRLVFFSFSTFKESFCLMTKHWIHIQASAVAMERGISYFIGSRWQHRRPFLRFPLFTRVSVPGMRQQINLL